MADPPPRGWVAGPGTPAAAHRSSEQSTCNKWSCKLYLEGKVQREHFFKNKALRIPTYLMAHPMFQN